MKVFFIMLFQKSDLQLLQCHCVYLLVPNIPNTAVFTAFDVAISPKLLTDTFL